MPGSRPPPVDDEGPPGAREAGAGAGNENRRELRARASADEWKRYYDRADRARARYGDPFRRIIERAERRRRVAAIAAIVIALALPALVWFSFRSLVP